MKQYSHGEANTKTGIKKPTGDDYIKRNSKVLSRFETRPVEDASKQDIFVA
jgi:hypothetical protein